MNEIREDQKAKLSFKLSDNSKKELDCIVKKVYNDRLALTFPKEMLSYADYLQEGEEVPVELFTPSGVRVFNAMILSSPLESEFMIEYDDTHQKIQRREYTRAKLETKLIIERLDDINIVTHTLDIAGGGVKFFYGGRFRPNEIVCCRLYLPFMVSSIKARGHIVNKPHLGKNEHIVLFTEITETERDKIIKKCFELQTENHTETTI